MPLAVVRLTGLRNKAVLLPTGKTERPPVAPKAEAVVAVAWLTAVPNEIPVDAADIGWFTELTVLPNTRVGLLDETGT